MHSGGRHEWEKGDVTYLMFMQYKPLKKSGGQVFPEKHTSGFLHSPSAFALIDVTTDRDTFQFQSPEYFKWGWGTFLGNSIPVGNPIPVSFSVPSVLFVIFIYSCQCARLDVRFKARLRVFVCLSQFARVGPCLWKSEVKPVT